MQVKFIDLTLPQYWLPRYDWVLSLEVLEHIPATFETVALDNIDHVARRGIVLSWATCGQGGFHHVNNRSPEYVSKIMSKRGFTVDMPTSVAISKQVTPRHINIKRNLRVYIRKQIRNDGEFYHTT